MTAFHTIAVPHEDILAGRLTIDVFAADLWEVHKGRAPDEYRDPVHFFQKTYQTEGLSHLLDVVAKRLRGEGGDPVIQVQTPFGGGKTHALIAMYHKAAEWDANQVVVVGEFLDYAVGESLLPAGVEPSQYRRRFEASYPFLPEVVDVLYQRWGSFPSFQRTRGVLRLLSLVVHALKDQAIPYITLADFDLANQEIRRELLKHIGPEFDSVVASDISGEEAGGRKVDGELGAAYQGLRLGTRVATSIFLYSFSGGVERGATLGEVKRSATTLNNPASVVAEAVELLRGRLFYLQQQSGKVFFTNQPNLNRILLTRMENIEAPAVAAEEEALLKERVGGKRLKVFPWPTSDADIPDSPDLKLILLQERDDALMQAILKQKGTIWRC